MANRRSVSSDRYQLFGTIGSPYALKLRSFMRYKRIPYDWRPATFDWLPSDLPHKPICANASQSLNDLTLRVVPAMYFPRCRVVHNESTKICYLIDDLHPEKEVIPSDAGLAFLSHLIEDMADEWFVKIAFLRRWGVSYNAQFKSRIVTGELLGGGYDATTQDQAARHFAKRQQSRMPLVGCTNENKELIEASFTQLMSIVDRLFESATFLFGESPTLADFGLYGQLQSLATDPTSRADMCRDCMGAFPYLQILEDASGIDYVDLRLQNIGPTAVSLCEFAADLYFKYLKFNAEAMAEGLKTFSFMWHGHSFTQRPVKYHAKCLRNLREEFGNLPRGSKADVADILGDVETLTTTNTGTGND